MTELTLQFEGPYSWMKDAPDPYVFEAPAAKKPGIYLWTVPTPSGELVFYVGETGRDFATRLTEHLRDQLAGIYRIYDPEHFARGHKKLLWGGMLGKLREPSLSDFIAKLPTVAPALAAFARMMRFQLAPLDCDAPLRQRVEAAIADHFYAQEGLVGDFQDDDISYRRSPLADSYVVKCSWSCALKGAPDVLTIGGRQPAA